MLIIDGAANLDLGFCNSDLFELNWKFCIEILCEPFSSVGVVLGRLIKFTGLFRADLEISEAQGGFLFDRKIEAELLGVGGKRQVLFGEPNAVRCPAFAVSEGIGPADILALKGLARNYRESRNTTETEVFKLQHERLFRERGLAFGVEGNATGNV